MSENIVSKYLQSEELFFFLGPCVIENESIMMEAGEQIAQLRDKLGLNVVFKSSFDKANRTSLDSYRGPGLDEGLKLLQQVGQQFDLPLITDIHLPDQAAPAADAVDALQVPAFLSRQTDLLVAAAETGLPVNVKKGQFLDPGSARHTMEKVLQTSPLARHAITERGNFFGYNRWVVDMRNLVDMRADDVAVIYDATHSIQTPAGKGGESGGDRRFIFPLARAAVATGVDGLFMETHPRLEEALCDAENMLPLNDAEKVITKLLEINEVIK